MIGACCIGSVVTACSDDEPKAVQQASCNAICTRSYSEESCKAAGSAAGCEKSVFVPTIEGCTNGCTFEKCNRVPVCGAGTAIGP